MKFALVTDPHLVSPGQQLHGLDPVARLARVVASIPEVASDIDRLVLLGDLTDDAAPEAYEALLATVSQLNVPITFLLGNHDVHQAASQILPRHVFDSNGFAQSHVACSFATFLFLDTVEPGSHAGTYCNRRMAWLDARLAESGDRDVYIFMHHPPADAGTDIDHLKLDPSCGLMDRLRRHGRVRHVFCGHIHRTVTGASGGLGWTALHGTNQQLNVFYRDRADRLQDGPSQVAFAKFRPDGHVLQFHDAPSRHTILRPGRAAPAHFAGAANS